MAIACGPSNITVPDLDRKDNIDGVSLFEGLEKQHGAVETLVFETASGSEHRVYAGRTISRAPVTKDLVGIDAKSGGGYIVGPGSTINAKSYKVKHKAPIAPAPQWWCDLAKPYATPDTREPIENADAPEHIAQFCEYMKRQELLDPDPDSPDYADNAAIVHARMGHDYGLSEEVVVELGWDWAERSGFELEQWAKKVTNGFKNPENAFGVKSHQARLDDMVSKIDQKPATKLAGIVLIRASAAQIDRRPWNIHGVQPAEGLGVTVANPNEGKTFNDINRCGQTARGGDWFGHKCKQGAAVFFARRQDRQSHCCLAPVSQG